MNKKFHKYVAPISIALLPLSVFAQRTVQNILADIFNLLNGIIVFLILLATVIFVWGIVKYILAGGDEEKVKEARTYIIYSIIFLAVMIAIWGFVNIFLDFVLGAHTSEPIPVGPQGAAPAF